MAITLPTTVLPAVGRPALRRFGGDLTPSTGGPNQRFTRLGSRFALDLTWPAMLKADAEALIGALINAETLGQTVIARWSMSPLAVALGSPLVNGGSQAGATLNADSFTSGVAIPVGTPFSFVAGGRNFMHVTRAAVTATGGAAALPIGPMLRASPADNTALNFATPQIEGWPQGDELGWDVDTAMHYGLTVKIFEAA